MVFRLRKDGDIRSMMRLKVALIVLEDGRLGCCEALHGHKTCYGRSRAVVTFLNKSFAGNCVVGFISQKTDRPHEWQSSWEQLCLDVPRGRLPIRGY